MPYPYDDDIEPEDAIVPLNPERTRWDVHMPMYVVAILRKQWAPQNTNGVIPIVNLAEKMKGVPFRRGSDFISVYELTSSSKAAGSPYNWTNDRFGVSLEFQGGGDSMDAVRLEGEARRVLQSYRNDTFGPPSTSDLSGRQWLEWAIRRTPWKATDKQMWRRTIDCEINWRYREVEAT